jgi:hypothetical protein
MLEIRNQTPFAAAIAPALDKNGIDYLVLVLKCTFSIGAAPTAPQRSDFQVPIAMADQNHGEAGKSSVKYEAETCLRKPGTDVVLVGHAYPSRPKATTVDVSVSVAKLTKTIRVFGDRRWLRMAGFTRASEPLPFERVPLVYERAFGGPGPKSSDGGATSFDPRNPVGTGFVEPSHRDQVDGLALPNLEEPSALIKRPEDQPAPQGFGYVGRHWTPRAALAGTYDAAWESERSPFLPDDFDERFFNGASPGLVATPHLRGGEDVKINNASSQGDLAFQLPSDAYETDVWIKGKSTTYPMVFDTLIIEPDESRFSQVWRSTVPCPGEFLSVDRVRFRKA